MEVGSEKEDDGRGARVIIGSYQTCHIIEKFSRGSHSSLGGCGTRNVIIAFS